MVTMTPLPKKYRNYFCCGKQGHFARDCREKKKDEEMLDTRGGRKRFKYADVERIVKKCSKKSDEDESGAYQTNKAMVTVAQTAQVMTESSRKFKK